MLSVEDAYQILAQDIRYFIGDSLWDKGIGKYEVSGSMVSSTWFYEYQGKRFETTVQSIPFEHKLLKSDAVNFIKDDLLKTTGVQIWGIVFTLTPNGKFSIEFSYEKPKWLEN